MSEAQLASHCDTCQQALGSTTYMFGAERHTLSYPLDGETPSEQALMTTSHGTVLGHYCSSACCKQQLGQQLAKQGLPEALQHNRVLGGPIVPCAKCGTVVNLAGPHTAWIKGKLELEPGDDKPTLAWMDVLAVSCESCSADISAAARSRESAR